MFFFLIANLLLAPSTAGDPVRGLENLKRDMLAAITGQKATYGIAFRDLGSGRSLYINEGDRMHAASTMKVPVMMRLFQLIDQGRLHLDQAVPIKNEFKSIVDGSPFQITVDSDEALYEHMGKALPLEKLITAMIARSSNLATNLLIQIADPVETTALMKELGAENIQVLRGVEDLKAFELGRNNECSAGDMLAVMVACVSSDQFSSESRDKMIEILRLQEFNDMIPGGIPRDSGARVAHKTGSISRVQHDAAIVDLPDGRRYGLVIFSRDFQDERERVKTTARRLSRLAYDYMAAGSPP